MNQTDLSLKHERAPLLSVAALPTALRFIT